MLGGILCHELFCEGPQLLTTQPTDGIGGTDTLSPEMLCVKDRLRELRVAKALKNAVPLAIDTQLHGQIAYILLDLLAEQRATREALEAVTGLVQEYVLHRTENRK